MFFPSITSLLIGWSTNSNDDANFVVTAGNDTEKGDYKEKYI